MTTNRQRAERENLTTEQYFHYAMPLRGGSRPSWIRPKQFDQPLAYYMCDECKYIPNVYCENPKSAVRAHIKKHHPATFFRKYAKPFVIHEEDDVEPVEMDAFVRELLYA